MLEGSSDNCTQETLDNRCIVHCCSLEETRSEVQRITNFHFQKRNGTQKSNQSSATNHHHSLKQFFSSVVFKAAEALQIMEYFEIGSEDRGESVTITVKKLKDNANYYH